MNDDIKKTLALGMAYGLVSICKPLFNEGQIETYDILTKMINDIFYPKQDLSQPIARGES